MSLLFVSLRYLNFRHFSTCKTFLQKIYSTQEKDYILSMINKKELPRKGLSANHIEKIYQYVEKKRICSLEELMNVNGVGPKVLRKICDSILCIESDKVENTKDVKRLFQNLITPPIDDLQKKDLTSITAVHIGSESISWVLLNSVNKCLIEWDLSELAHEKRTVYSILLEVQKIAKLLPNGNIYILEEIGSGRNSVDHNRNLITAMLSSFIQAIMQKENGFPVLAFLKPVIKNKIYNGSVGNERVSLQSHVVNMIEERSQTDCIRFPKELKEKYFALKPNRKEDMAQALLLATSFINIFLNQRSISFK